MSRPRFLADHDLNEHVVAGVLRAKPTIEIVRARDVNLAERSDGEILEYAGSRRWLVVSHDVNTMTQIAVERIQHHLPMPGLILVQQSQPVASVIEELVLIWSASEFEEWGPC